MSPLPRSCSAPPWSRTVRESIFELTWKLIRLGIFALINPVITSTEGRCVARIRCIPAARAFCARRAISWSTFLPTIIIMSANSSMTTTINGSVPSSGAASFGSNPCGTKVGSVRGVPASWCSRILLLNPSKLRTPSAAMSLYRRSISATHQRSALAASFMSVTTGANKCGMPS